MSVTGHLGRLVVGVLCTAMAGVEAARAQCDHLWTGPWPANLQRQKSAMAYDTARGEIVLFGGAAMASNRLFGDTWAWNGAEWRQVSLTGPSIRNEHAMAFDSGRGRVVLFGGFGGPNPATRLNDTWEWDGAVWTQVASDGPSARQHHAMAYDAARGKVVLFGGYAGSATYMNDTWEWDGTAWTQVASDGPAPREQHAMAYDAAHGRVILFGGAAAGGAPQSDTWAWDGTAWTQVASGGPPARLSHVMTYDSELERVVMYGGHAFAPPFGLGPVHGDTWAWDGAAWTQVSAGGPGPGDRYEAAAAFDAEGGRTVIVGGRSGSEAYSDTWTLDGSAWSQADAGISAFERAGHAAVYDSARDRLVVFGESAGGTAATTMEWDGDSWTMIEAAGPSARDESAMAYDAARGVTVMYGGVGGTSTAATWLWDGESWTEGATAAAGPGPRSGHAMAYDAHRQRVVMWGGQTGLTSHADTWEWDGTSWTQMATVGPAARIDHAMGYDAGRQRVVMHGGIVRGGETWATDTWEWDGTTWTQIGAAGPGRYGHTMAYDESAGRMMLFGGSAHGSWVATMHYWTGSTWSQLSHPFIPPGRIHPTMVYDSAHARMVVFGGQSSEFGPLGDVWYHQFGPGFLKQPDDVEVAAGGAAEMWVTAGGTGPFTYQWRKDGVALVDGGAISGATADRLRIEPAAAEHAGTYDCVATNACRSVTSTSAALTVTAAGCRVDLNGDGFVDFADYLEFLNLFEAQDPRVDFNMDGIVDFADYLEFLNLFDAGC